MADDQTQPTVTALTVDRAPPIGNTKGPDGRNRAHVKITNGLTEAIPVVVTNTMPVNPTPNFQFFFDGNNSPGTGPQSLFSALISAPTATTLWQAKITCKMTGRFRLTDNGTLIGERVTGAGDENQIINWIPNGRAIPTGHTLAMTCDTPASAGLSNISVFIDATDS